jgi:hypothetical protein
LAEKV